MDEEEKCAYIDNIFGMLDLDGNGTIDIRELESFIMNQGMSIPQQELQDLIDKIDTNRDGKIQLDEFRTVMLQMMDSNAEDKMLEQIFNIIDREHDEKITHDELKYALNCLGEDVTDQDVKKMISHASQGKNDYVTLEDFIKVARQNAEDIIS